MAKVQQYTKTQRNQMEAARLAAEAARLVALNPVKEPEVVPEPEIKKETPTVRFSQMELEIELQEEEKEEVVAKVKKQKKTKKKKKEIE